MSAARKTAMLVASIFTVLAFCWQANACFAEHAGLIPCHEQAGDASSAGDIGEGHCCHIESTAMLSPCLPGASVIFQEVSYQSCTFGVPDGPIQEIEYPPQLLS